MLNVGVFSGILDLSKMRYSIGGNPEIQTYRVYQFYPNQAATRAEVFGFARNILDLGTPDRPECQIEGVDVFETCEIDHGDVRYGKYIEVPIY
jgi:hypothetical protein